MISVTIDEVQAGDQIRFSPQSPSYTVTRTQIHSFEHSLRFIEFGAGGPGAVTMPATAEVFATEMWRTVEVPCLVVRHQGMVAIRYNKADGGTPRGVICGDCDAEIMDEIMAQKEQEEQA